MDATDTTGTTSGPGLLPVQAEQVGRALAFGNLGPPAQLRFESAEIVASTFEHLALAHAMGELRDLTEPPAGAVTLQSVWRERDHQHNFVLIIAQSGEPLARFEVQ